MSRNEHFTAGMLGLPTHATARQMVAHFRFADLGSIGGRHTRVEDTNEALMERKYKNAQRKGLVRSILEKGYDQTSPIEVAPAELSNMFDSEPKTYQPPYVVDGHHRVAVMYRHFPDTPIPLG